MPRAHFQRAGNAQAENRMSCQHTLYSEKVEKRREGVTVNVTKVEVMPEGTRGRGREKHQHRYAHA